ncbi:MAG: TA system VapC family ribonuclease toxin [Kineosporiaceae bacterium]
MKLLDVNLLVYAYNERVVQHARARPWFEELMSGTDAVALSWHTVLAFLRLTTRAQIMSPPLPVSIALRIVESWLGRPNVVVVQPTSRHLSLLSHLLEVVGTAGNRVPDAHLAALAIEHGAVLCSADADFRRFPGLRWEDPLA